MWGSWSAVWFKFAAGPPRGHVRRLFRSLKTAEAIRKLPRRVPEGRQNRSKSTKNGCRNALEASRRRSCHRQCPPWGPGLIWTSGALLAALGRLLGRSWRLLNGSWSALGGAEVGFGRKAENRRQYRVFRCFYGLRGASWGLLAASWGARTAVGRTSSV